jgi:uncharacterized protein YjbI with pentapeptide repeats
MTIDKTRERFLKKRFLKISEYGFKKDLINYHRDFIKCKFIGHEYDSISINCCDFFRSIFFKSTFHRCEIGSSTFEEATIEDCRFTYTSAASSSFKNTIIKNVEAYGGIFDLYNCASIEKADLSRAHFTEYDWTAIKFIKKLILPLKYKDEIKLTDEQLKQVKFV